MAQATLERTTTAEKATVFLTVPFKVTHPEQERAEPILESFFRPKPGSTFLDHFAYTMVGARRFTKELERYQYFHGLRPAQLPSALRTVFQVCKFLSVVHSNIPSLMYPVVENMSSLKP